LTSLITQPLSPWQGKFWHHLVHQHLGETLFYFLVRVRPFDPEHALEGIRRVIASLRLGSVRAFPIFGQHDLLIRAWLHPTITKTFETELYSHLGERSVHGFHTFSVTNVVRRWYDSDQQVDTTLLRTLTGGTIPKVQTAQNPSLLQKLAVGQLVQERGSSSSNSVNFFIAINLESYSHDSIAGVVEELNDYSNQAAPRKIDNISIYNGYGFCQILFKGQAPNYFDIAPLTNFLSRRFKTVGLHTETFLCHGATHPVGDESIGEATLWALQGRSLFVQAIIPELYSGYFGKRREVEYWLEEAARNSELSDEDKKPLHDYLLAYLNDDPGGMMSTLSSYFSKLEGSLRNNHAKFIAMRMQRPQKEVYRLAGIDSGKRSLVLGDLFNIYSVVIQQTDPNNACLAGDWDDLTNIRNMAAHGEEEELLKRWKEHLGILVIQLPRIRQLRALIEQVNKGEKSESSN